MSLRTKKLQRKNINIIILLFAAIAVGFIFFKLLDKAYFSGVFVAPEINSPADKPEIIPSITPFSPKISPTVSLSPTPEIISGKDVFLDVPYTSQAPFGNWKDPKQQDGCEEAAALMAVSWARGETLTPKKSLEIILAIADYEEKNYGNYHDTDAEDTADIIFRGYFGYENIEVRHQIGIEDIKQELFKGNLVVVPTNGRKLGNPRYTQPGPLEHALVIRGYDTAKKEFITNDPGILYGENYRYREKVLEGALSDYPTGYKEPAVPGKTAMIVVWR